MIDEEQKMFFDKKVANKFAEAEENEKNKSVSKIIESIVISNLKKLNDRNMVGVNLFGGVHADRYSELIKLLKENNGRLDWVDYSEIMLDLAKESLGKTKDDRKTVLNFIHKDYMDYINGVKEESLDFVFIIYSLDYIKNFDRFFSLLYKKMKKNSFLVSTVTISSDVLPSHSTNARYFYGGDLVPSGESVKLKDGDSFGIGFFKETGNPKSELIEGAYTTKYYFSVDKIKKLAEENGFNVYFGDWKKLAEDKIKMELNVLFLSKGDIK